MSLAAAESWRAPPYAAVGLLGLMAANLAWSAKFVVFRGSMSHYLLFLVPAWDDENSPVSKIHYP
jgi:hypothetical protein